jgi:hypothetical protein
MINIYISKSLYIMVLNNAFGELPGKNSSGPHQIEE